MFPSRKRREPPSGSAQGGSESGGGYFRINRIRLYQPDPILESRLTHGVAELAAYMKALKWVGIEYFGGLGRDFGSLGLLVVVGIKPGRRVKFWCEQVGGHLPADVWDVFVELLEGGGEELRPLVTEPVAFAIEFLLGAGPSGDFPVGPTAWLQAATRHDDPLEVPDGTFEIVFPD